MSVAALDIAGNGAQADTGLLINRTLSGYIRDYTGAALSGVNILLCGDADDVRCQQRLGYYEFIGLRALAATILCRC